MDDIERLAERLEEGIEVHLAATSLDVVVMGPDPSAGSDGARLREHIAVAAADYGVVVKPEHRTLMNAAKAALKARNHLTAYEMHLVRECDLVVLIPDSPGSLCELGLFSAYPEAKKLIILANNEYPRSGSYVSDGPLLSAQQHNAEVHFLDYTDLDAGWAFVEARIQRERANRSMANLMSESE